MFRVLRASLVVLLLVSSTACRNGLSERRRFIDAVKETGLTETGEVTASFQLQPLVPGKPYTRDAVVSFYHEMFAKFSASFPSLPLTFSAEDVIRPFDEECSIENITSIRDTFSPLDIRGNLAASRKHFVVSVTVDGKTVPGLRTTADTAPNPFLLYVEDINARILGFTDAMLVPELSSGVEPSDKFDYNGDRDWTEHKRYGRLDQVTSPLRLTNFVHVVRGRYCVVSDHPDFSLAFRDDGIAKKVLTFFLWKRDPLPGSFGKVRLGEAGAPDFIWQLVLTPPASSPRISSHRTAAE